MSDRTDTPDQNNHALVQPIHTAVKGRARFKVKGLYHSESLKQHLEFNLNQDSGIVKVLANPLTGNILIFFAPNRSFDHIAAPIEPLVLNYRKQRGKSLLGKDPQSIFNHCPRRFFRPANFSRSCTGFEESIANRPD